MSLLNRGIGSILLGKVAKTQNSQNFLSPDPENRLYLNTLELAPIR